MAFLGLLLLLLLHQTFAELEVWAPSAQQALNGSTVVLPCTFSFNKAPFDPKYLAILWSFRGRQILVYDRKGIAKDPRVSFDVEAANYGNASLTVTDVTLSDGGTYSCLVVYSPERIEKDIELKVQVRPVILLKETVCKDKEISSRCLAAGFFPWDIEITWLLDGKFLNRSSNDEPVTNKDGTYNVTSHVTSIKPTLDAKTLSCVVHHASLHEPLQENFKLSCKVYCLISTGGTPAWVIAVSIIVVILILIAASLWWKRKLRKKDNGPFTVRDIEGPPKLIDGEEATLHCTVDNCPKDLCVTWLIRRDGQDQEIQTSQLREHEEEEESLLDTSYVIKSKNEGRQYLTSLSFIPHMERHRDVTFICRGVFRKHEVEKKFHSKTIYGKPKMLQPIMRSLFFSGEVKYLLSLEKFYPKTISIGWQCGVGTEEVISTVSRSTNPDRSYNVSSEVRIPEDCHKDPGFSVRVTWKHESMEEPESRELSIRDKDYIWTPVVEDIQILRLHHNTPTTLQCNISEYFPDAITVKWMRVAGDEIYEETDNNQRITSRSAADNTYMCTASLTITPTLGTHQGAEYICVVNHPSLERPMEKSTGRLQVIAKPQMLAPIEITMEDKYRLQFSLNLQKFYPKDINISWHWENQSGKYGLSDKKTTTTQDNKVTYDVTSFVQLPDHTFSDPEMKVTVVWKHETMEIPETRSLSIRDLPWCPHVGSINLPKLEDDKAATLTCKISGYFPDLLSVIWFTMKDGNLTALSKESLKMDRRYKISEKKNTQKDNTYCCEASMTFTPLISSDQRSEIICRVGHPSLEHYIDRSTGPLHIGVKSNFTEWFKDSFGTKVKNIVEEEKDLDLEAEEATENLREDPQ
ncbi:uncharacterized protein RB166_016022 [Leptodactylus fuscus]